MEEVNATAAAPAEKAFLQPPMSTAKFFSHEGLEMPCFWEVQLICPWEIFFHSKISG